MLALPVLEHLKRLQSANDVDGVDSCLLANLCATEKQEPVTLAGWGGGVELCRQMKQCQGILPYLLLTLPLNRQQNQDHRDRTDK